MKRTRGIGHRPTFTASALPFEFVAALPLNECITRLKKMTVSEPPSDIAFFRLDADMQRFYLKTRAFHSPLIETKGMLQRTGENQTTISGEIYAAVLFTPLLVVFFIGLILLIIITLNIWVMLIGFPMLLVALIYWRSVAAQAAADKVTLAHLIQEAVTDSA